MMIPSPEFCDRVIFLLDLFYIYLYPRSSHYCGLCIFQGYYSNMLISSPTRITDNRWCSRSAASCWFRLRHCTQRLDGCGPLPSSFSLSVATIISETCLDGHYYPLSVLQLNSQSWNLERKYRQVSASCYRVVQTVGKEFSTLIIWFGWSCPVEDRNSLTLPSKGDVL